MQLDANIPSGDDLDRGGAASHPLGLPRALSRSESVFARSPLRMTPLAED
jgi:hypothetical protein